MRNLLRWAVPATALAVLCGAPAAHAGDPFGLKSAIKETTNTVKQDAKAQAGGAVAEQSGEAKAAAGAVSDPKAAAKEQERNAVKGAQDGVQQGAHDGVQKAVGGVTNPGK